MCKILNLILFITLSQITLAKSIIKTKKKSSINEFGISLKNHWGHNTNLVSPEFLFKHWYNSSSAVRFNAGYEVHSSNIEPVYYISNAELLRNTTQLKTYYKTIGFGFEKRKHLYRRLFYSYALDARVLSGISHSYNSTDKMKNNISSNIDFENISNAKISKSFNKTQAYISPAMGLQLKSGRFVLGYEKFIANVGFIAEKNNLTKNKYSIFDLNIGSIANRFTILYTLK